MDWQSKWFSLNNMPEYIGEDFHIRNLIRNRFSMAAVSWTGIERAGSFLRVNIHTARPGLVIGKKGVDIEALKKQIETLTGNKVFVNVIEIKRPELDALLSRQLANLFTFSAADAAPLQAAIGAALERCAHCFAHTDNKYYARDGETYFNPFHSGQYSIFLYFVSRAIWEKRPAGTLADRVYYLNKALNGLDLFYEVNMPAVFCLDHPVGTVIGRGSFGDGFTFSQNCTIGNNKGRYPVLGRNVTLLSGAKVLGDCTIGDNVIVAANTYVKDHHVPSDMMVFGSSPELTIKPRS